ncbi:hypothetical protein ACKGJI_03590 [Sulfurospirillum sp. 1307]|jgi:hypothetical protein
MKKILLILLFFVTLSYAGIFEHLLSQDKNYLFKHNFRCNDNICIASEKNIYDDKIMDTSVKVVKVFLDHEGKVFKIEIELSIFNEKHEAFFNAIIKSSQKDDKITYKYYTLNDKYGVHPFIDIIDNRRRKLYIEHLTNIYYDTMQGYKE